MKNKYIYIYLTVTFIVLLFNKTINAQCTISTTITTVGTTVWTCPAGITSVTVQCWGGGGGGGGIYIPAAGVAAADGGGGAGGSFSQNAAVVVVPGNNYNVVVGAGGTAVAGTVGGAGAGGPGGSSSFNGATVVASGGAGGGVGNGTAAGTANGAAATGSTVGSTGTTLFSGGNGSAGSNSVYGGGGGGGGAGTTAVGGNSGGTSTGGTGGTSGGGNGGSGYCCHENNGNAGTAPGGGGGGAYSEYTSSSNSGGTGGSGQVVITYTLAAPSNDLCAGAVGLVSGVAVAGNNTCGTSTGDPGTLCSNHSAGASSSVWYSYTPATSGQFSYTVTAGTMTYPDVTIYSATGACAGYAIVADISGFCGNGPTSSSNSDSYCLTAGTQYYIIVGSDNWQGGATGTFTLTPTFTPLALSVNSPSLCSGSSTTLTATGASTYTWSTSATTNTITVTPSTTTDYTVTGAAGSCTAAVTSTVSVCGGGQAVATTALACPGYATTLSLVGAACVTGYQWQSSPDDNTWTTIAGATGATYNTTINTSTYFRCVETVTGCGAGYSGAAYCQAQCDGGIVNASASGACSGSYAQTLTLVGTACVSSYQWQSSTNGTTWTNFGTNSSSQAVTVSASTYYQCVVTCAAGVTSTSTPVYCAYQTAGSTNDNCGSPTVIATSNLNGTWNSGFSFNCATYDNMHQCNGGGGGSACPNTWFTFTAQGPDLEISTGSAGFNAVIDIFQGTACGALTYVGGCAYPNTFNNGSSGSASYAITAGQQYYVMITSSDCSSHNATYSVQINNPTPNPPGTDCSTAQLICSNGNYGGAANLWGSQELSSSTVKDCNASQEINSSWFVLNILQGGTLNFSITPTDGTDDYDFALYKGSSCTLNAPVSCNYSGCTNFPNAGTGISSAALSLYESSYEPGTPYGCRNSSNAYGNNNHTSDDGDPWNSDVNVNTGDVYLLYINGFTPSSSSFNFTFGGTAVLGCTLPTVLPISLLNFTAVLEGNQVNLNWSTTTEIDNDYFTIARSADGKNFDYFTKVKGAGNSNETKNYATVDYEPLPGTSYYRLSQTDFNGNTKNLTIKSVNNKNDDGMFSVFPNPTTGILNINYSCSAATGGILTVYDCNGMLVTTKQINCVTGTNKTQLDLGGNASGMYLITFTTNDKFYSTKLIKN